MQQKPFFIVLKLANFIKITANKSAWSGFCYLQQGQHRIRKCFFFLRKSMYENFSWKHKRYAIEKFEKLIMILNNTVVNFSVSAW